MEQKIKQRLLEIEAEYDVKILYAVESGSRAWGFSSHNSDYDVRFIYVHRLPYYLNVGEPRDVIEKMEGDLDFSGWELKKALRLMGKSNPPLMEWLASPIIYKEEPGAIDELRELGKAFFSPKSAIYHYLHMAEGNYNQYIKGKDEVKIKKYLYVLRPLLACNWIREIGSMPPMKMDDTLALIQPLNKAYHNILALIAAKRLGDELNLGPKNEVLNIFIDHNIGLYNEYAKTATATKADIKDLSNYLLKQVKLYEGICVKGL